MALRRVLHEGDPVLRKHARKVSRFDDRLQELAQDMLETMRAENGVGLAAPQVGILKRMFVMNVAEDSDEAGDLVVINPEIVAREGENSGIEGCLSLPGIYGVVKRPERITLRYQNLSGEWQEREATGLEAVCICHENDHLEGILFKDKLVGNPFRYSSEGETYDAYTGEKIEIKQPDNEEIA